MLAHVALHTNAAIKQAEHSVVNHTTKKFTIYN